MSALIVGAVFVVFVWLAAPCMVALGRAQAEDELDRRFGERWRR